MRVILILMHARAAVSLANSIHCKSSARGAPVIVNKFSTRQETCKPPYKSENLINIELYNTIFLDFCVISNE